MEFLIVPVEESTERYLAMVAGGNAPQLVGPHGISTIAKFKDQWEDVTPYIEKDKYDMSDFYGPSTTLNKYPELNAGLPLGLYPSFIFYNKDAFDAAGLEYPTHDYADTSWIIDSMKEMAVKMTLDANGNTPADSGFDPATIKQWGYADRWTDFRGQMTMFGADTKGRPTSDDYKTAQVNSAEWLFGAQWLHDGVFKDHFIPDAAGQGAIDAAVEGYAYEIGAVTPKATGAYDQDDVQLAEVEKLVCDPGDPKRADRLVDFWLRHLAREGTRPLTARSIAEYLAPTSVIAQPGVEALARAVSELIADDSAAAGLVSELWKEFVSYLSEHAPSGFDQETYVAEFYVAVLARLICANVIEKRALRSNDDELDRILNGQFFIDRGINRLVEYDYFGWLTAPQHIDRIRPCAAALQADLAAFDFGSAASEDLFGEMVSQFAGRKQRLLLGQEWTPRWLAAQIGLKVT